MKKKECEHKIVKSENNGYVCARCGKEAVKDILITKRKFYDANLYIIYVSVSVGVSSVLFYLIIYLLGMHSDLLLIILIALIISNCYISYRFGKKAEKNIYTEIDKWKIK